eukprot:jgi/Mesvir1/29541/Mv05860-RA.1
MQKACSAAVQRIFECGKGPVDRFSRWWRSEWKTVRFPGAPGAGKKAGSVFDYYVDTQHWQFVHWAVLLPLGTPELNALLVQGGPRQSRAALADGSSSGDQENSNNEPTDASASRLSSSLVSLVHTPAMMALKFLAHLLLANGRPVLLAGTSGCGKSLLLADILHHLPDDLLSLRARLSYYSSAAGLQEQLESGLEKKTGRNYGPPGKKRLVFAVDDLSLPRVDAYGTQAPIAMLQQIVDLRMVHDRSKLSTKQLLNCQYMAALNPVHGSFTINPRVQRHFVALALREPTSESLAAIYTAIVKRDPSFLPAASNSGGSSGSGTDSRGPGWGLGMGGSVPAASMNREPLVARLVAAALELHERVGLTFRKSARNAHYEFSPHHLTALVQGICVGAKRPPRALLSSGQSSGSRGGGRGAPVRTGGVDPDDPAAEGLRLARLVLHEGSRVYCDCMASAEDLKKCQYLVTEVGRKYFVGKEILPEDLFAEPLLFYPRASDDDANDAGAPAGQAGANATSDDQGQPGSAGDFVTGVTYSGIASYHELQSMLEGQLALYNSSVSSVKMSLVLFQDAMCHLARIARALALPFKGHAMLVGVGGSGRRSLARLASFVAGATVVVPTIAQAAGATRGGRTGMEGVASMTPLPMPGTGNKDPVAVADGLSELKDDLRDIMRRVGVKGERVAFMLADTELTSEKLLAPITELLATGDVAELWTPEDKDDVFNGLRVHLKMEGLPETRENSWALFLRRVQRDLHVLLCASPGGALFQTSTRRFPSLLSCTTIDFFFPWPPSALVSVARQFLDTPSFAATVAAAADHEEHEGSINAPSPSTGTSARELSLGKGMLSVDQTTGGLGPVGSSPGWLPMQEALILALPRLFQAVNEASIAYAESDGMRFYTTPKSFLELLRLFQAVAARRHAELSRSMERLQVGLEKMRMASADASALAEELAEKQAIVSQKATAAKAFAEKVGDEKVIVAAESDKVAVEADNCAAKQAEVSSIQQECQEDLAKAEPAVAAAEAALNTLNKKDIGELKALKKPPSAVDDVTAAVMVLLSPDTGVVKDRSWVAAQKMMGLPDRFLEQLKQFKNEIYSERVPAVNFKAVRPYLDIPSFNVSSIMSKSRAAAGLCGWVRNIATYYDIICDVAPKRARLAEAEHQLADANEKLQAVLPRVEQLRAKLAELEEEYRLAMEDKRAVEEEAANCQRKLDLATRLMRSLASEQVRWSQGVEQLQRSLRCHIGDSLLGALAVSYLGFFPMSLRHQLVRTKWAPVMAELGITSTLTTVAATPAPKSNTPAPLAPAQQHPVVPGPGPAAGAGGVSNGAHPAAGPSGQGGRPEASAGYDDPLSIFVDEATVASWREMGLPSDITSRQNAAIVVASEQWPFLLDPQLQGLSWLKQMEVARASSKAREEGSGGGRGVSPRGHPRGGSERWGDVPGGWGPRRHACCSIPRCSQQRFIQLGGQDVAYHPSFRLYLHTTASAPHIPPEVQAETTLVNFCVTEAGLEEQLLSRVVRAERPALEAMQVRNVALQNGFRLRLKDVEDSLLRQLAAAGSDILGDELLVERLEDMKAMAEGIQEKVELMAQTEAIVETARGGYRAVAARGSLLFFLMAGLGTLNPLYQHSLATFLSVFLAAIGRTRTPPERRGSGGNEDTQASRQGTADDVSEEDVAASSRSSQARGSDAAGVAAEDGGDVADGSSDASAPSVSRYREAGAGPMVGESQDAAPRDEPNDGGGRSDMEILRSEQLPPSQLAARIQELLASVTEHVFCYVRRGLFERHKLAVACQLCLAIMLKGGQVSPREVEALVYTGSGGGPAKLGPGGGSASGASGEEPLPMPLALKSFLPEACWPSLCQVMSMLEATLGDLSRDMEGQLGPAWAQWVASAEPEGAQLPGRYNHLPEFHRLVLLRVLRGDRLVGALHTFVETRLGKPFVEQEPFSLEALVEEASPGHPLLLVLFPGASLLSEVTAMAMDRGLTEGNGLYRMISLGQGQDARAHRCLLEAMPRGGWVFLGNVHLMPRWLPVLERVLEQAASGAHPRFRVFLSAEAGADCDVAQLLPASLVQRSTKAVLEPPQNFKANLWRAFGAFTQDTLDDALRIRPPTSLVASSALHPGTTTVDASDAVDFISATFAPLLFATCVFHALLLGRRRFGHIGWSKPYAFSGRDLAICGDVLRNYLAGAAVTGGSAAVVPWDNLRFMFGEIMYGGHIIDVWDRRLCGTYLAQLLRGELLLASAREAEKEFSPTTSLPNHQQHLLGLIPSAYASSPRKDSAARAAPPVMELVPGLKAPRLGSYRDYCRVIEEDMPAESASLFGLHANAESQLLADAGSHVCAAVGAMMAQGGLLSGGVGGGGGYGGASSKHGSHGGSWEDDVNSIMVPLLERLPVDLSVEDTRARAMEEDRGNDPQVAIVLQEAARMNTLLGVVRASLAELKLGVEGALTMSQEMEDLATALFAGRVPDTWAKAAYPSLKPLAGWYTDLLHRVEQLFDWVTDLAPPPSVWLSGLFNPMAFLTSILQVSARAQDMPLDSLAISTEFTRLAPEDVEEPVPIGALLHGLYLQGAR